MSGIVTRFDDYGARGRVAFILIDRPNKLNIFDLDAVAALKTAALALHGDEALRAVVVAGLGERAFSGGADIKMQAQFNSKSAESFITALHQSIKAVSDIPVPVICCVRGYCLGWAPELVAACDLCIAADDAKFGMPEVKVGVPSVIEAAMLPRLINWGRTAEMLYLGEMFDAQKAERIGLIEKCVPAAELDAALQAWIDTILGNAPLAIRAQKALMKQWLKLPLAEAIQTGIKSYGDAFKTDEPKRFMSAFINRPRKK